MYDPQIKKICRVFCHINSHKYPEKEGGLFLGCGPQWGTPLIQHEWAEVPARPGLQLCPPSFSGL